MGGAPVAAEEIRRTMRRFGAILSQGYGRIEGGWPIATLGIDEHRAILAGCDRLASSCGRPIEQVKIKLRPTDAALDRGELLVAGEMTVGEYTDPDGWCSLGDIMYRDRDGYLFYRGRLDRMINTGYHVYPGEIEAAILAVSGIAAARVKGEDDEKWGTTLVADVVLASEAKADADGVLQRLADALGVRLAKYKIPRRYRIVEALSE